MKRRNFLKMLPVGLLAVKLGGLVDLVRPKKPYSLSVQVIPMYMKQHKKHAEFFQAVHDSIWKEWIEKEGLQKVFDTPANPEYYKWRVKDLDNYFDCS